MYQELHHVEGLPIQTDRLILRQPEVTEQDIQAYLKAVQVSLPVLEQWVPWAYGSFDEARVVNYINAINRNWIYRVNSDLGLVFWVLTREPESVFVGNILVWNINWQIPKFEIGYWANQEQTGHGYITEAVRAVVNYCLTTLKGNRVEIICEVNNIRSKKVPERLGFNLEGSLKNAARTVLSHRLTDVYLYACTDVAQLK